MRLQIAEFNLQSILHSAFYNSTICLEVNGARWPSRSSKSVAPRSRGGAGFDSQALPPAFARCLNTASFGWQATRKVSAEARRAKADLTFGESPRARWRYRPNPRTPRL